MIHSPGPKRPDRSFDPVCGIAAFEDRLQVPLAATGRLDEMWHPSVGREREGDGVVGDGVGVSLHALELDAEVFEETGGFVLGTTRLLWVITEETALVRLSHSHVYFRGRPLNVSRRTGSSRPRSRMFHACRCRCPPG